MKFHFLHGIDYAILHGWQGLPEHLPSDLDIVLASEELARLEQALLSVKKAKLVNLLQHETTCYYFVLALEDGNRVRFLPVDVALDYRRDGRVWFSAEELLQGRRKWKDFWVAAPEVEFQYLLVKKVSKESLPHPTARRMQELVENLGEKADALAGELLGERWATQVMIWIREGQWEAFEEHMPILKRVLLRRKFFKDPLNLLRYWLPELKRIWRRWQYPTGLWVAVLGPDGAGKSTLIQGLQKELAGAFRRTTTFHLMPRLFRKEGDGGPVTDPHGKPPRSFPASLLKLAYYWLDYTLGYWLKVRPALVRSTFVFFDRYYDDLLVDPKRYRYGGPMWLARWLRRFIPRPDLFLVLDVPVEKLLERKQEVPREEVERQVAAYRRFALETPNALLLDGGQPPEAVVLQARDALLDLLHERYLARRKVWFPEKGDDLAWLSRALGVAIGREKPTHAYLRLPDGRGFLLPLENARAFRQGLNLYPAQGRKGRWARGLLAALSHVGLKAPGLRKVRLEETSDSVFRKLREIFGREDLSFAISLGTPGPHRKPVVQVLTPEGQVLGYAKVGWNEKSRNSVANEAEMLLLLKEKGIQYLRTAEIVLFGKFGNKRVLVTKPVNIQQRRGTPELLLETLPRALQDLSSRLGQQRQRFDKSFFWLEVQGRLLRIEHGLSSYQKNLLLQVVRTLEEHLGTKELPFTFCLGDVTPWNAFVDGRGVIHLVDLEYAKQFWLPGWDIFHLVRSSYDGLLWPHSPVSLLIEEFLKSLGIPSDLKELLYLAYLVDVYTEWCDAWRNHNEQKSPEALRAFRQLEKEIAYWTAILNQEEEK